MNDPAAAVAVGHSLLKHVSIRASAGSGKTYKLASRYLQLIAAGAEPGSILASTFTRMAAGEIRDRILLRVAEAIDDQGKRRELQDELGAPSLPRASLLATLASLARRLDQMQVRTLDSFFAAIVHAFAIELDIPIGALVVDEHQAMQMRSEAIRLMLDERRPQDLVDLLRLLTQGASERGVTEIIDATVKNLYALYREGDEAAWECVPEFPTLREDELNAAIEAFREFTPPPNKTWEKAHAASIEQAWARDWPAFIDKGLPSKLIAGEDSFARRPLDADVRRVYEPLIEHARGVLVGRVRDQTIATRELLKSYHAQYETVKRLRRAVTFDDLAAAMVRAQRLGKLEEIGFRLDAKFHHLLLDEFQDTSVAQWRALEPIAQEIVSYRPPERTFFCVGDVKQSIYGWRDAAPEVLDELPNLLMGPNGESAITQRALARSFRSSPIIIDAVNQVFESLRQNDAIRAHEQAVDVWLAGFDHHETQKQDLPGHAELRTAPRAKPGQNKNAIRYAMAADLAADLHQKNPNLSIAILTRTNGAVAALLYELGPSRRNIAGGVSGRGGGPLTDAPAINAVLDLLQLADHPGDTVAAFNVSNSPLGAAIDLSAFDNVAARHRTARQVRRQLLHEGYSTTIAGWVNAIAPSCDPRELRRLLQLIELASIHDQRRTLRTSDFIEYVETTAVADAQPAAVQVMTIHKSKGLEFDAVILPELEHKLTGHRNPPVVFERDGGAGPITAICRYINKKVLPLVPELQRLFDVHRLRTARESLSLLYVAMTRARHALHMMIDPPAENEKTTPKTLSCVLRCALAQCEIEPDKILFCHGDAGWIDSRRSNGNEKPSPAGRGLGDDPHEVREPSNSPTTCVTLNVGEAPAIQLAPSQRVTRLGASAKAASALAADQPGPLRQLLALPNEEARDRGAAIHALFEQIEWLEDFALADEQLLAIVRAKSPRRDERWARTQVSAFRAAITLSPVREALCRGRLNSATVRLHREHPFARRHDGGVQRGSIDRLIVHLNDDGSICSAVVIDFKTDAIDARSAGASADHYRRQMEIYRDAVAEMLGIRPEAIALRLLFVAIGECVDL